MPIHRCYQDGKAGWQWGNQKCYVGPRARSKALAQARAIRASGYAENASKRPLGRYTGTDPTRTITLRKALERKLVARYVVLKGQIRARFLEDFTTNAKFKFTSKASQVKAFLQWLQGQMKEVVVDEDDDYWRQYIRQGYEKGAGRAWEDARVQDRLAKGGDEKLAHYAGTKEQFLREAFAHGESVEKVKLLASRVFTDLKGVNETMASRISAVLTDGLVQGQNPFTIAKSLADTVDGIGINRARVIARTEIIRAHAEGQLDALERMGIEDVGVQVELDTAGDGRVCSKCQSLDGTILKIKDAHGVIPVHPQCRCAFIPALNVLNYNPNQPRDYRGRWTSGGAGYGHESIPDKPMKFSTLKEAEQWAISHGGQVVVTNVEDAAELIATEAEEFASLMIAQGRLDASNRPSHDEIVSNWKKLLRSRKGNEGDKPAFKDLNLELQLEIQNAANSNRANPEYQKFASKHGDVPIIFRRQEKGRSCAAEERAATHVYDSPFWQGEIESPMVPGQPTAGGVGGYAAVLRHEYGHKLHGKLTNEQQREWASVVPPTVGKDVTSYAATNKEEAFCEIFAITTDERYTPGVFPAWVDAAKSKMEEWLL